MDHYRRERSRQQRQLEIHKQIAMPLDQNDKPPAALTRSGSSPILFDLVREQENAPNKPPPVRKIKASDSSSLPRIQDNIIVNQQECAANGTPPPVSNLEFDKNPAFARHLDKLHFLVPGHLAYVATTPIEISHMKADAECSNVSVVSSYLHKQYMPLCADFGPVALNVVHRFCQVLTKCSRLHLCTFFVEREI